MDGGEDLRVAGTAAEVAGERLADRLVARAREALEQVGHGDDQTRRAEAALHGARLDERLLHGIEVLAAAEVLDGADGAAVGLDRRDEAGADEPAVEPDRARAALPLLAGVLRARQLELVAEQREQARRGRDVHRPLDPVDRGRDRHAGTSARSAEAHCSARRASTSTAWRR